MKVQIQRINRQSPLFFVDVPIEFKSIELHLVEMKKGKNLSFHIEVRLTKG